MLILRSILFSFFMILSVLFFGTVSLFTFPFPLRIRYNIITGNSRVVIWLAEKICGIHYEVSGLENLPKENVIILSNHQSTWETFVYQVIFPLQTWVLKKELLYVPFFGWALAQLEPIAINRKLKANAMEQLLTQGKKRLQEGRWVIIFPEGTRIAVGKKSKFTRGGATLAESTGVPVVPVAHNAGKFWGRRSFIKKPGIVKVVIGQPITTKDKTAATINAMAQAWIEKTRQEIE